MEGGVHVFDKSLQKANLWLEDLMKETGLSEDRAYKALKGTLHELRDRLTKEEAADFASQLPTVFKGIFYEGWIPSKTPKKYHAPEFISRVHSYLQNDPNVDPHDLVKSIFNFLKTKISKGEVRDVRSILPREMQELWQ